MSAAAGQPGPLLPRSRGPAAPLAPGTSPALLLWADGPAATDGGRPVDAVAGLLRRRLPEAVVRTACLGGPPTLVEALGGLAAEGAAGGPPVVVPLVLSPATVRAELARAHAGSPVPLVASRPVGPHPLLAAVMVRRLEASGARLGDAVVMVADHGGEPDALAGAVAMSRLLQAQWGAPVRLGCLGTGGPTVSEAAAALRAEGHRRLAAVPYLLGSCGAARLAHRDAAAAGVVAVAEALGGHPLVAEVALRRYLSTCQDVSRAVA